mmetsp:Transcript_160942/g.309233  ORF Transcript_160942/g.309233 Transcript_160942/m.309233 type:complete len:402 (-) Transcript_160942:131-1336(-)
MGLQSPTAATAEHGLHAGRAKRPRKKSSRRSATETQPEAQQVSAVGESSVAEEPEELEQPEKRLRFVDVLTEIPNGDAASATELIVNDRGYSDVDSLESCRELRKLELRGGRIDELSFLEMNHNLCWLGLSRNRLSRISHLENLGSLAVLDLSDNQLTRLDGLAGLTALKALIVARNKIASVEGLSPKRNPSLETLVLSHNRIADFKLTGFPSLRKLSLAQNQLHAFPSLTKLPELAELRLNGNRIGTIGTDVSVLPKLAILDIGNNLVSSVSAIEPLRGLRWMKSLNLLGNPVANDMDGAPLKGLLESLQKLEIVNNRRLPSAPHKQKQRAFHPKKEKRGSTDSDCSAQPARPAGASRANGIFTAVQRRRQRFSQKWARQKEKGAARGCTADVQGQSCDC